VLLVFVLNSTHHWVSRRTLVTMAIGVGALICFGGLMVAPLVRRSHTNS
jgi:hypothetical protein